MVMHEFTTTVEKDYTDAAAGVSLTVNRCGVDGLSLNVGDNYTQTGNTIINPLANAIRPRQS